MAASEVSGIKMPTNQPVIKFSPFEALLIGEKNSILRRQPMKNAIFVSRLNRQCKAINLRVLFGLDKNETEKNDVIFKVPQRVQDFLKSRKKENVKINKCKNKKEILHYEFEGQKLNNTGKSKRKKTKCKASFKRKRKKKDKFKDKAVRKFPKPTRNNYTKVLKKKSSGKSSAKPKRKSEKSISPKQKHLASYVLYLKEERKPLNGVKECKQVCKFEKDETIEQNIKNKRIDLDESKNLNLKILKTPEVLNFDDDSNLLDIVYENFPKVVKFECKTYTNDFSEALIKADLVKAENLRPCNKNGLMKNDLMKILTSPFPLVRCQRVNNIMPDECIMIGRCAPDIDKAYLKKNNFFFNSKERKDVFGENKVRPKRFVQNSCLRSLQQL